MPVRITTYKQAFEIVGINSTDKKALAIIKRLSGEGRSEKSICFSIWKSQDKIRQFKYDTRFYSILENEIKKWSWSSKDPRWNGYNKRKEEQMKAKQEEDEIDEKRSSEFMYKQRHPGYIYFIQGEAGGAIKIGFSFKVEARLKSLQTGYPDTLKVLCILPGSEKDELFYHNKFAEHRLRGEWFSPTGEVLDRIEEIKRQEGQK